jgi:hypothetical protein
MEISDLVGHDVNADYITNPPRSALWRTPRRVVEMSSSGAHSAQPQRINLEA